MKLFPALLTLLIFATGCSSDKPQNSDPNMVSSETFTMKLGDKQVYGVRLRLTSSTESKQFLGYEVSLYQNDKVWIDTLFTELSPKDTLESELIFSKSEAKDGNSVSFKTQSFSVEY